MSTPSREEEDLIFANDLSDLVHGTLGENEASGINGMLQCIAKRFQAFGCGLWEISDEAERSADPAERVLVTVAAWWEGGVLFAMDDVPLEDSPSALVALKQDASLIIDDIQIAGGAKRGHEFWKKHRIRRMCASPVRFLDGHKGVVNVYRREIDPPFTELDKRRLARLGQALPGIYRAIRERIGLKLVNDVESKLRDAEGLAGGTIARKVRRSRPLTKRQVYDILKEICDKIAEAFNCVETTLFLEDPDSSDVDTYHCVATTDPATFAKKRYRIPADESYKTGWVLANWAALRVQDLSKLERDLPRLQKDYPGLERTKGDDDQENARQLLGLPEGADLPPLSFMAVPVFGGNWLRGALRCHLARRGPYYFSEREEEILSVVAAQIGHWWSRWRARVDQEQENKSREEVIRGMAELNTFVRDQLIQQQPDKTAILKKAVRFTSTILPGAQLNGIRLYDAATNELYFAHFSAGAEAELKRLGKQMKDLPRFPVRANSIYDGVKVFRHGQLASVNPNDHRGYTSVFPSCTWLIMVPIGVGDERDGILDLRWTKKSVPPYAVEVASLLGQQLGIYLQLVNLMQEQKAAVKRNEKLKLEETSAYEDFVHQLRSPINQAKLRAELGLVSSPANSEERRRWLKVRGLIRRAEFVAGSMRILTELSHNQPLSLRRQRLDCDFLVQRVIELADDTQLHVESKRIEFKVDRKTFTPALISRLSVDLTLFEQMLSNLLDNAGKYGKPDSRVHIFAGHIQHSDRIYVAVTNQGLRFQPGDVEKAKSRGWRSLTARMIAQEGRGIGLWLVSELMKAHGGELLILPDNNETEVRLAFNALNR